MPNPAKSAKIARPIKAESSGELCRIVRRPAIKNQLVRSGSAPFAGVPAGVRRANDAPDHRQARDRRLSEWVNVRKRQRRRREQAVISAARLD
jgi:hypothetical protein